MKLIEEDVLLRIFISEKEKYRGHYAYEYIVSEAKAKNLSGATVIRGIMGFGSDKHLHNIKLLELSTNLPVIIEIVDSEEKINEFIQLLDEILQNAFITLEKIKAIRYKG